MKNKKKYELGSIVVVDKSELFKQSHGVNATSTDDTDSHSQNPFFNENNSIDFAQYDKVAMAGPFGT